MCGVAVDVLAQNIATGLSRNFPQHQQVFEKNLKAYVAELDDWIGRWEKMAAPLRGIKFVEYHPEWIYLADRFGMKRIGSVELKPGIEPTPNHLVELTQQIKQEKARLLIYGSQNPRIPQQISNETGIKVLRLFSGGGSGPAFRPRPAPRTARPDRASLDKAGTAAALRSAAAAGRRGRAAQARPWPGRRTRSR